LILAKTTSSSATAQASTPFVLPPAAAAAMVGEPVSVASSSPPLTLKDNFSSDVTRRKNRPFRAAIKVRISLAIVSFLSRRLVEMYSSLRPAMIFCDGDYGKRSWFRVQLGKKTNEISKLLKVVSKTTTLNTNQNMWSCRDPGHFVRSCTYTKPHVPLVGNGQRSATPGSSKTH
jgi:hypothetical protein